jgi:EF-P beta-lysylation protein EpmB
MKNPWQKALIEAITNPKELLEVLELPHDLLPQAINASKLFPLKVPRSYLARMQKNNRYDPLLLQVLPVDLEEKEVSGYTKDPLDEKKYNPIPGLLHKYKSRVLLTMTGVCGVHCRFCFRRHFPYSDNNPGKSGWNDVLAYIANDKSIHEVILSGGDPLAMSDHLLSEFTEKLAEIPHLKRLRIHTRMPIVIPERVSDELIDWMSQLRLKTTIVIHCNHANEINADVKLGLKKLAQHGVILLNQTVLLKGVNDTVESLTELSESLFGAGVLPYYLHVLDKVQGAAHFDISHDIAKKLHTELTTQLSGYLVPRLVTEQAGAAAKLNLL